MHFLLLFFSSGIKKQEEEKRVVKIPRVSFVTADHGGEVWGCSLL